MKVKINAEYDYTGNNVSEKSGYSKWYDWNRVKKHIRTINIILWAILTAFAFMFRNYFAHYGIINFFIVLVLAIIVWLFIITPIHEVLHLLPLSKGNLNDRCIITVGKGTASALYNGHHSRNQEIISLLLPFLFFTVLLFCCVFLTSGMLQLFFIFLLALSCYGSYTDIYMIFYVIKHIKNDELIFGLYKKQNGI